MPIAPAHEPAGKAESTHRITWCDVRGCWRVRALPQDLCNTVGNPIAPERRLPLDRRASVPALEAASAIASA